VTARTGHCKSSWCIIDALAGYSGRDDIHGREVKQGRSCYLAIENPNNIRMQFAAAAYELNLDVDEMLDGIEFIDLRYSPELIIQQLQASGKEYRSVYVDTHAAMFDGDDPNNPVQAGGFMRRLRPLCDLPGKPCVFVPIHPVKAATKDTLIPSQSGAIINEVDGNLTLWQEPGSETAELHWLGKIRGRDFEPIPYKLVKAECDALKDAKGKVHAVPVLRPVGAIEAEHREYEVNKSTVAVLRALSENPRATIRQIADDLNLAKSHVQRITVKLTGGKLVSRPLGLWQVSKDGLKLLEFWGKGQKG
jgi:IclR helix-turn-helix domain